MAKALICDVCSATFAQTASEGANGKWSKVRLHVNGDPIYVVYGTFTPPPRAMLARLTMPETENLRGTPTDVCPKCTLTLIARYLTEGLEEDNEHVPEGGHEEHPSD